MSKGGGTTSTIDPRLFDLVNQNYTAAKSLAAKPFTPYSGQLVAAPSAATGQGQNAILSGAMSAGDATANDAIAAARELTSFKPGTVSVKNVNTPAGLTMGDNGIGAYMNPYLGQVADRTLADLDRFRQMAVNENAAGATLSNAFGGDRQAVTDSLTNEAFGRQAASTLANLYSGGFDTAAGLLMSDKARALQAELANQGAGLQAGLANQSAGIQGAGLNLSAANQLGQLSNAQLQNYLSGAGAVMGVGAQQDQLAQANLNAAYDQFLRQLAYPYQQQQVLNSALGMFGNVSGTQQYTKPTYPGQTIAGMFNFGGTLPL